MESSLKLSDFSNAPTLRDFAKHHGSLRRAVLAYHGDAMDVEVEAAFESCLVTASRDAGFSVVLGVLFGSS